MTPSKIKNKNGTFGRCRPDNTIHHFAKDDRVVLCLSEISPYSVGATGTIYYKYNDALGVKWDKSLLISSTALYRRYISIQTPQSIAKLA